MKVLISADSTIDLPKDLLQKYDIRMIPFTVLLGTEEKEDGVITEEEIFDFVEKNKILPRTCAINEFQYEEKFESYLKEADAVVHFCLGSGFSSAYSNAVNASKKFKNVFVIDSKSLSTGIALLAIYASKLAMKNTAPEVIVKKVKSRIPYVQASFVLDTLEYLHKGGRCSSLVMIGASLLRLKPQIIVTDGKMVPGAKYRGRKSEVVKDYCDDIFEQFGNPDLTVGFVTHTNATEEMISTAIDAMKRRGFKTIYETVAGATITSHCGPKCLGVLFINDGLDED